MTGRDDRYDDIINLPHHVSRNRHHMSLSDRAAQFAPFDALNGYSESIRETGRRTEDEVMLSENELDELDLKFRIILENISKRPLITVKRFVPDEFKSGGKYVSDTFRLRKYDEVKRQLISEDKRVYDMDYVSDVSSEVLDEYFKSIKY